MKIENLINLEGLSLILLLQLSELFIVIIVYFSQYYQFIDNDRDSHQDYSGKSLKITKLLNQQ